MSLRRPAEPNAWMWPRLALKVIVPAPVQIKRQIVVFGRDWLSIVAPVREELHCRRLGRAGARPLLSSVTGPLIANRGCRAVAMASVPPAGVEDDSAR